jgi:hypothetical protein
MFAFGRIPLRVWVINRSIPASGESTVNSVKTTKKMKINTNKIAQKLAVAKQTAKAKVTTKVSAKVAAKVAAPAPEKDNPFATHKAYNRAHCQTLSNNGIGANLARCGNEIIDSLVTQLIENRETLTSTRLAASDKVLLIESPDWKRTGSRVFAYPVLKASGDVLEVIDAHADKPHAVRVSFNLLKKAYAPISGTVVRLVAKSVATTQLAKHKAFAPSKQLLGVS